MPATLNTYLKSVQRFCRDSRQELLDPADLIDYINQGRREVAMRAQCIRVLPPISGAITTIQVTNGGSQYTNPQVVITPPDSPTGFLPFPNGKQAIGTATAIGGVIVNVAVNYGGSGYFAPQVTINDPTGAGFTATVNTSLNNTLNEGQEAYPFSGIDLSYFPGVASVYFVRSASIIYSNYRYSLPMYAFSTYQSLIRQYVASQYQYVPTFCSQFGQGVNGTLFMYPVPSQSYQLEFDCQCLPQDLIDNQSVEALPDPWTDCVGYWAAALAYLELQNGNAARMYFDLFDKRVSAISAHVRPGRISNPYGRW
jgi:hypothetical protein